MVRPAGLGELQQHVGGFDVPVDEAASMRRVQRGGRLGDERAGPGDRQRPDPVDQRPQVAAGNVAHGDVQHTVRLPGAEHRDDVRVLGGRRYPGLLDEPGPERLVAGEVGGEHLQGGRPVEVVVVGAVDHGHAATADLLLAPVARQPRSGREPARHRREFLAHRASSSARHSRCAPAAQRLAPGWVVGHGETRGDAKQYQPGGTADAIQPGGPGGLAGPVSLATARAAAGPRSPLSTPGVHLIPVCSSHR